MMIKRPDNAMIFSAGVAGNSASAGCVCAPPISPAQVTMFVPARYSPSAKKSLQKMIAPPQPDLVETNCRGALRIIGAAAPPSRITAPSRSTEPSILSADYYHCSLPKNNARGRDGLYVVLDNQSAKRTT